MRNPLVFLLILTLITSVGGLALGGLLATLLKRESPHTAGVLLSFTAGLMLAIVSLDMLPEAVEYANRFYVAPLSLVLGFGVTFLLNCWIDKSMHHEDKSNPHHCACGHHDLRTAGIVLAAAVALHNMPVGMTIGSTVAAQGVCYASVLLAVTIGLHNIPEGMSIAIPLLHDGSKVIDAVMLAALSGVPTIIGALMGYHIGQSGSAPLGIILGVAAGAMLYVVFFELIPEAWSRWKSKWTVWSIVLGFALGVMLLFQHIGHHGHVH